MAAVLPACGGGGGSNGSNGLSKATTTFSDPDIETFPNEGQEHVPVGTPVVYHTDPPTSGPHYPDPQPGGFYSREIAAGFLVHSMEHGGVIIYYGNHLNGQQRHPLRDLASQHPGLSAQVVVVPRDDATYPIILTAWTHRLRLTSYDALRIDGFITLFIGQGPENAMHSD
jgi:hypothetical protein